MLPNIENCPQPNDLEPMCFGVNPVVAVKHAELICERIGLPKDVVRIAFGLVIPNISNPEKILYGLRDPNYHTEYKNTWGLPSTGVSKEEFFGLEDNIGAVQPILKRLSVNKLSGVELHLDRFIAWTGRIRLNKPDSQFDSDYYLIMVDLMTQPIPSDNLPTSTPAYSDLKWFTPEEHAAIVAQTPNKACGACSELASLAKKLGAI